ncbi:MAG: hypothetical protein WC679_01420 [Bacteroidales bacterium]|jgi:hypothetical protein
MIKAIAVWDYEQNAWFAQIPKTITKLKIVDSAGFTPIGSIPSKDGQHFLYKGMSENEYINIQKISDTTCMFISYYGRE